MPRDAEQPEPRAAKGPMGRVTGLLHALIEDAAHEAGCTVAQILGRQKHRRIAWARQRAMARAYEEGFSAPQIGRAFGGRDHTTVLYAAGKLKGKRPSWQRWADLN